MEDGRKLVEETYKIIKEVADGLDGLKSVFSDAVFSELEQDIESSLKWAKYCRNKVWLRSKEGTDRAQDCLDAANQLKAGRNDPSSVRDAAAILSMKLESLARVIASKASVLT